MVMNYLIDIFHEKYMCNTVRTSTVKNRDINFDRRETLRSRN